MIFFIHSKVSRHRSCGYDPSIPFVVVVGSNFHYDRRIWRRRTGTGTTSPDLFRVFFVSDPITFASICHQRRDPSPDLLLLIARERGGSSRRRSFSLKDLQIAVGFAEFQNKKQFSIGHRRSLPLLDPVLGVAAVTPEIGLCSFPVQITASAAEKATTENRRVFSRSRKKKTQPSGPGQVSFSFRSVF